MQLFSPKKKDVLDKYKFMLIILPLGVYLVITCINCNAVCYIELFISLCAIIYTNLIFAFNTESSYSILAFDKIENISTNYIFVIDNLGKVIYSNDMVKISEFFGDIKHIESVTKIFKCDTVESYSYLDKEYINIKKDSEDFYFSYSYSQLYHKEKTIGSVITITNITDLILLLNNLEDKKAESKKLNEELKNYSKVVYHLEKEKEINNLLEEIVLARDGQMKYLTNLIKDTKAKIDDKTFENYIEISIDKSNEILEDVRKTVTKNREYYGGVK